MGQLTSSNLWGECAGKTEGILTVPQVTFLATDVELMTVFAFKNEAFTCI
ncbi:hypothetical protein BH18ACI1_BH18ACI1_13210 [soil metagenome]